MSLYDKLVDYCNEVCAASGGTSPLVLTYCFIRYCMFGCFIRLEIFEHQVIISFVHIDDTKFVDSGYYWDLFYHDYKGCKPSSQRYSRRNSSVKYSVDSLENDFVESNVVRFSIIAV